jgi:succinate dehydrogenase/fumarate reductase cytochrome b subunit
MRKLNTIISALLLGLFVFHGIMGGYQLFGVMTGGSALMEALAWAMIVLLAVHVIFGIIMTVDTITVIKRAKIYYPKENTIFVIRRISGFVLMLLVGLHLILFVQTGNGVFRLNDFDMPQMIGQMIMLIALALHVLCNIRPLAVALGLYGGRGYMRDLLVLISIVLLFCGCSFVVYYLRWNVWWR